MHHGRAVAAVQLQAAARRALTRTTRATRNGTARRGSGATAMARAIVRNEEFLIGLNVRAFRKFCLMSGPTASSHQMASTLAM